MWKLLAEKLSLDEEIPKVINEVFKFDKITKVQNIVINEFLKNKDVIVKSVTGSGKTISYIIPIIQRIINYSKQNQNIINEIYALILLPARELAEQVYSEITKFTTNIKYKITSQLFIGGKKIEEDINKYKNQIPNIIIATPGRFLDFIDKEKISLSSIEILILDEADRMLDMGFEMSVSTIISKLPKQRRTGLFSATVTSNVENIIKAGMRNPEFINIIINQNKTSNLFVSENEIKEQITKKGSYYTIIEFSPDNYKINNTSQEVPKGLGQYYREIKNIKYKIPHLIQILYGLYFNDENKTQKIMIFLSTCFAVDYFNILLPELFKKFNMTDFSCSKLHSKISQNKREKEYKNFKIEDTHKLNILLTTDLSARGIDIPDVDIILQFDPPKNEDSYIHKAGRTARVGNTGVSIIFLCEEELSFINYMKQKFIYIEEMPYPYKTEEKKEEEVDIIGEYSILKCIKEINMSDKWIYDKAVNTFISFLRFYKENELKYIFDIRSFDIGNFANSFQLLKLPRLKINEFKNESIKNFVGDDNIEPIQLKYLDKNIKKQMEMKKEKINQKLEEIRERKKLKKEIIKLNGRNNGDKLNRTRKEKKEVKIKNIMEQWDDLADDDLLYKKYKKGKISKEEYEKHLLSLK